MCRTTCGANRCGYALSFGWRVCKPLRFDYTLTAEKLTKSTNRAVLEITIEGRPTVMHGPIVLLNGNLLLSDQAASE